MEEIFKDIPNYEGLYQVSNLGNVKSLPKNVKMPNGGLRIQKEKILKYDIDKNGYFIVSLYKNCKSKKIKVHQLVAMAFLNHKPNGMTIVVDHKNNDRSNNRLENLQLLSNRENCSKDKKNSYSQYVGVVYNKRDCNWRYQIHIKGKTKFLGYFSNELEAHNAYQNVLKNL
jgi:hypothetical protein